MFLGIDLGTSGAKLLVTDERQSVVAEAHAPVPSRKVPAPWSEQDPQDWIAAIEQALSQIAAAHPGLLGQVRGIGLSGQYAWGSVARCIRRRPASLHHVERRARGAGMRRPDREG